MPSALDNFTLGLAGMADLAAGTFGYSTTYASEIYAEQEASYRGLPPAEKDEIEEKAKSVQHSQRIVERGVGSGLDKVGKGVADVAKAGAKKLDDVGSGLGSAVKWVVGGAAVIVVAAAVVVVLVKPKVSVGL